MTNSELVVLKQPFLYQDDTHLIRVRDVMNANYGQWMTLGQLSALTGITKEGSIASRIRDLRAQDYYIEKREHADSTRANRIFEYRMV